MMLITSNAFGQNYFPSTGNVRIATTNSDEVLNVKGNLLLDAFNKGDKSGIFFRQEFSPAGMYNSETYLRNMSIRMKKLYHSYIDVMDISAYGGILFGTSATDRMFISQNGKIGIGTLTPFSKLDIISTTGMGNTFDNTKATLRVTDASYQMLIDGNEIHTSGEMHIASTSGVINLFKINSSGPVDDAVRVDVDGKLWAEEIEVKSEVDADYVFEEDYDLRSLEDVEAYVKSEKHLPDMPSAVEFAETGQNLAKMDNLLLRKVEELTLYVIELQKQIEDLQSATTNE